jgi:hypothetical protein
MNRVSAPIQVRELKDVQVTGTRFSSYLFSLPHSIPWKTSPTCLSTSMTLHAFRPLSSGAWRSRHTGRPGV